eukprot:tig00000865_g5068.t1
MIIQATPFGAVGACVLLALVYVASLYVWSLRGRSLRARDDPAEVKQRFISVIASSFVAAFVVRWFGDDSRDPDATLGRWLGLHGEGLGLALWLPLAPTVALFAGPLALRVTSYQYLREAHPELGSRFDPWNWLEELDVYAMRNLVVGPITEEVVFRACMVPLLFAAGLSRGTIIAVCPLFFGIAHAHHVIEHIRRSGGGRYSLASAIATVVFQLFYTTLFGAYSTFLLLRTGHLAAAVLAHAFCNFMGFPDFEAIWERPVLRLLLLAGIAGFCALLLPATDPALYASIYYYPR